MAKVYFYTDASGRKGVSKTPVNTTGKPITNNVLSNRVNNSSKVSNEVKTTDTSNYNQVKAKELKDAGLIGNVITNAAGEKFYTSVSGQRFSTPEQAAQASIKIKAPGAFNPNLKNYDSSANQSIREAHGNIRIGNTGVNQPGYFIDSQTGQGYSGLKAANEKDIYLGVPGSKAGVSNVKLSLQEASRNSIVKTNTNKPNLLFASNTFNQKSNVSSSVDLANAVGAIASGRATKEQLDLAKYSQSQGLTQAPGSLNPVFDRTSYFGKFNQATYEQRQKLESDYAYGKVNAPLYFGVKGVQSLIIGVGSTAYLGEDFVKSVVVGSPQDSTLVKGISGIVSNPVGAGQMILGNALADPFAFTYETIGGYGAFKILGYGAKAASSGVTKIASIGKTYIPAEKLVAADVLSGASRFPTARSVQSAISQFEKTNFKNALGNTAVYSASDYSFLPFVGRNIKVASGRGLVKGVDVPGIYTSTKGVSTYFLRLQQDASKYSLLPKELPSIFPKQSKILAVYTTPSRIPAAFRTSLTKAQSYFGKQGLQLTTPKGVPGKPYFSPALEFGLKNEAEAVIQIGSKLNRIGLSNYWEKATGFSKFTKIQGKTIPIYEYQSVGSSSIVPQVVSASKYAASSSGYSVKPILSYSVLGSFGSSVINQNKIDSNSFYNPNYSYSSSSFVPVSFNYSSPSKNESYSPSLVQDYSSVPKYSQSIPKPSSRSYYSPKYSPSFTSDYNPPYYSSGSVVSYPSYSSPSRKPYPSGSYSSPSRNPYSNYYGGSVYSPKRKFNDEPELLKRKKKFYSGKVAYKLYTPSNIENVLLPTKVDWLKSMGLNKNMQPKIKTFRSLTLGSKGLKEAVSIIGL